MFIQNIRHEIRLLSRSNWFLSLTIILVLLCLYAGYNGAKLYDFRSTELVQAKQNHQLTIDRLFEVAQATEDGETPEDSFRLSPMRTSISTGAIAVRSTDPLSSLAIGQSDLYAHQIKISSREDIATLTFTEMNNPVQLLFGNFDLAFVLTYLVPLIIIAFTYNLQSQELESGRMRLVASNPINPKVWLFQRYVTRFISLGLILGLAILLTLIYLKIPLSLQLGVIVLVAFTYMSFWFAVSFLVNVFSSSSGKNAVVLLSLWIILVLIIPAAVNQTANSIYPTPSGVILLNEIRETKQELAKEQDKVIAEYLRNHPELVREEGDNQYSYWQRFFASQEMAEQTLSPLIEDFDSQVQEQQNWVNMWRFLSPAILFQTSITELAGTSSQQYNDFKQSVKAFTVDWREYFMPMVFDNRMLSVSDLEGLPTFEHATSIDQRLATTNLLALIGFSLILLYSGFRKQHINLQL